MRDRSPTDGQANATIAMPGDAMNTAARHRKTTAPGDDMNGAGQGAAAQDEAPEAGRANMPIPQPHNIALRHHDGALTVDWHTAPNGYEVALVRGRNEILNQPCVNPPTTLPTDAVPSGQYCVTVKARTNGRAGSDEDEREPCIVKLATPTQIGLTYNEQTQQLAVDWQPVEGAQGYRVQLVQLVTDANVSAGSSRWLLRGTGASPQPPPVVQAWVQAKGDEQYYVDSNIGKSAPCVVPLGLRWGLFDLSHLDQAGYYPEDEADTEGDFSAASADMEADEEDVSPLTLRIAEKAGLGYTLDDNVDPPSRGQVADDGLLVHSVSPLAKGCVITFDDSSAPIELIFDRTPGEDDMAPEAFMEDTYGLHLSFDEDEEEDMDLEFDDLDADDDDDEATLSLCIPGKENSDYTLNDRVNAASSGMVTADGLMIHPVASTAQGCTIQFNDGSGDIVELMFAST